MAYFVDTSLSSRYLPMIDLEGIPNTWKIFPSPLNRGMRVVPPEKPIVARERSKFKQLPDFISTSPCWIVSDMAKKIVENLEPNIHQFLSVELIRYSGELHPERFYLFNVCQSIDSIVFNMSEIDWITNPVSRHRVPHFRGGAPHIVLDRAMVDNRHVWRGKQYFQSYVVFSNSLFELIEKKKLKKLIGLYAEERYLEGGNEDMR